MATQSRSNEGPIAVTRRGLFKEALYTGAHYLGKPTERFPATNENICLYAHDAFSSTEEEQEQIMKEVKEEPYPLTSIATTVIKGINLRSNTVKEPNAYVVVLVETKEAVGRRSWQVQQNNQVRAGQLYARVPTENKSDIKFKTSNPLWDWRTQCVAVHPSTDKLVVEVWHHKGDKSSINNESHKRTNPQENRDEKAASAVTKGKSDIFVGSATIAVTDIPGEEMEKSLELKSNDTKNPGSIRVRLLLSHLFRHGEKKANPEYKHLILSCLWDWILSYEKSKYPLLGTPWDGKLPPAAGCLLYQFALQSGISEDIHAYIRWEAYTNHKMDMDGLEKPLIDLNLALTKVKQMSITGTKSYEDAIAEHPINQKATEEKLRALVEKEVAPVVRNHLFESDVLIRKALKCFKDSATVLSKFPSSHMLIEINVIMERALRMAFLEWYEAAYEETVETTSNGNQCAKIKAHAELMNKVNLLLRFGAERWQKEFWMLAEYNLYLAIMYDELQKMVTLDVESVCYSVLKSCSNERLRRILRSGNKDDVCIATTLHTLYLGTQTFVENQQSIFGDEVQYKELSDYYKWFRPALVLWLGFALMRGSQMITRCVHIDTASLDNIHAMTSTSALDTAVVIEQMGQFWEKLNWPDTSDSSVILIFLLETMCYFTVLYAMRKQEKLDLEGYYDVDGQFDVSHKLCTTLNNIENVKSTLEKVFDDLHLGILSQALELECGGLEARIYEENLAKIFTVSFFNLQLIFKKILDGLVSRIRPEISRTTKNSLERLQTLKNVENEALFGAIDPLLQYVDGNVVTLSRHLLDLNFARILQMFWNLVLEELVLVTESLKLAKEKKILLYKRVAMVIPLLRKFFDNGDRGLDDEELNTPTYRKVSGIIAKYTTKTTHAK